MEAAPPLSVLLIGEQQVLLAGVRHALAADDITVISVVTDVDAATRLVGSLRPEVCVVLAPITGGVLSAVTSLRTGDDGGRVVVVSSDEGPGGELLLQALEAGADGWLSLDMAPDVLGRTLRAVRDGEPGISRVHVGRLVTALRRTGTSAVHLRDGRVVQLTRRERQTLDQLLEDPSTVGVARHLGVSQGTARWHIAATLKRLGADSREQILDLVVRDCERLRP